MSYAGDITPQQAWELLRDNPDAILVDVRTTAEWKFVGVPDTSSIDRQTVLIEWVDSSGTRNGEFTDQLLAALDGRKPEAPVIFLCRSGQRSIGAGGGAAPPPRRGAHHRGGGMGGARGGPPAP
uniref:rhodanese-like domain-containing protein n=1 Tax=Nocardia brasiliensis TaxID=37326 RepID=UPI0024550868